MKRTLVAKILEKVAPRIGARVFLEPIWGIVGQITFKSGRKRYFRYSTLDLNRMGASDIARDKDYAKLFMDQMDYPVIPGMAFGADEWAKKIKWKQSYKQALDFAENLGWPVILKPNSSSQGQGVTKVSTRKEFDAAWRRIKKKDKIILVEQFTPGADYRIVVLDDKVISAYQRIPLSIIGDGKSNILKLLKKKQKDFEKTGRDTKIQFDDPRIIAKLRRRKFSFQSVPEAGMQVFLLDNANLSGGGDSLDVTDKIHDGFKKLAVNLTRDMGLRLCGVDLLTMTPIESKPVSGAHWILEINSAPGLDHYASIGKEQEQVVEDLYLEVLKAMDHD
jgi:D-alanine-D-alanine ligase-like ATP-grasp enzyme